MGKIFNYTDEELVEKANIAESLTGLLRSLGYSQAGSNFVTIKRKLISVGIDPESIKNECGKGIKKNRSKLVSNEDVFCNPTKYSSPSKVKKRALECGYVKNFCEICGQLPFWNGKEMILILDHIDGNTKNNLPENLRCVCPNCNVQLETNCGKNARKT